MKNYTKALSEALLRVGCCEGVVSSHGEDEIAIQAGHFDDYLLVTLLGQMIQEGDCAFKINPKRMDYFLKLLHLDKEDV